MRLSGLSYFDEDLDTGLAEKTVNLLFDKLWPDLEARLSALPAPSLAAPAKRSSDEIAAESLESLRHISPKSQKLLLRSITLAAKGSWRSKLTPRWGLPHWCDDYAGWNYRAIGSCKRNKAEVVFPGRCRPHELGRPDVRESRSKAQGTFLPAALCQSYTAPQGSPQNQK